MVKKFDCFRMDSKRRANLLVTSSIKSQLSALDQVLLIITSETGSILASVSSNCIPASPRNQGEPTEVLQGPSGENYRRAEAK
jgi:hypothetical protein